MSFRGLLPPLVLAMAGLVRADGPADNVAERVRPVPPKGIAVSDSDRSTLQAGVDLRSARRSAALRNALNHRPGFLSFLPDVQIYDKAVRYALAHNEFYKPREIAVAKRLLEQGQERARQLREGTRPGIRRPAWSCAATSPRSTARFSLTASSCRRRIDRTRRIGSGSTSGATAAART